MMSAIQVVFLLIGWTLMLAFIGIGTYATVNQLGPYGLWFIAVIVIGCGTAILTYETRER
jgi:hypothetical protein